MSQQALELWELPREEVHISQTILGTGGWGYVAKGMLHGHPVAVKCLHRAILSPHNEERLRREISIMSQVRHPNLLLLIGAVLTAESEGPLIVTELLDMSLRSAYEEGLLEERSKVPVLRGVASALPPLPPHPHPPQRCQQCQCPPGSHRSCQTMEGQAVRLWQPTSATLPAPLLRVPLCTLLLRSAQRTGADRQPRSTCTALGCWCVRCVSVDSLQRGTNSPPC